MLRDSAITLPSGETTFLTTTSRRIIVNILEKEWKEIVCYVDRRLDKLEAPEVENAVIELFPVKTTL